MNGPRVLFLTGDESGCSLWRVYQPCATLQARGFFAHWKHKDDPETTSTDFVARIPFNFDAVILPRISWPNHLDGERWVRALHRAGVAVIYEIDDDVYSPSIVARQFAVHDSERAKGLDHLEQDRLDRIAVTQMADGVTVTSRRLATVVSQYTDKPIEVVPNAIDTRWWRTVLRGARRIVPPLSIGWAGGARYPEDLVPVAEAWSRIARRYPDVSFVVQGHMAEVLIDAVPANRCRRLPWLPLHEYPRGMLNIDIACCSVAPKLFNTAKTPIKLWEFTMSGAVCVVSPTLYGPVAQDGEDALVAETADEWEAALSRLVEDRELRRRLWRNQRRRIAAEHSMEANWWKWPAAWANIINTFRDVQDPAGRLVLAS